MRLICSGIVAALCIYAGFFLAARYRNRVDQLELCLIMLMRIKMYIECENIRTSELISRLARSQSLTPLTFIERCNQKLINDKNFGQAWNQSLDESVSELALSSDDYQCLKQLSEIVGICDSKGVLESVAVIESELVQAKELASEQNRVTGQLCRRLGVLAGLAAAIILL